MTGRSVRKVKSHSRKSTVHKRSVKKSQMKKSARKSKSHETFYCMGCKAKVNGIVEKYEKNSRGGLMARGTCKKCHTRMCVMVAARK